MKILAILPLVAAFCMVVCKEHQLNMGGRHVQCERTKVTCPCGSQEGKNVTVMIKQCLGTDNSTDVTKDDPYSRFNRHRDHCSIFKECETCMNDVPKCATCPEGMYGKYCTELSTESGQNATYSPPERRQRSLCAIPTHMDTCTFKCSTENKFITCVETCNEGYTYSEGRTKTIRCNRYTGLWRPDDFQECTPLHHRRKRSNGLCAIPSHMKTTTYKCNKEKKIISCVETCNKGHSYKGKKSRTITCDKQTGLWKPEEFHECDKDKSHHAGQHHHHKKEE